MAVILYRTVIHVVLEDANAVQLFIYDSVLCNMLEMARIQR